MRSKHICHVILFAISYTVQTLTSNAIAQCDDPPDTLVEQAINDYNARSATVAIDACGRIVVGWEGIAGEVENHNNADVFVNHYDADGSLFDGPHLVSYPQASVINADHGRPSIAISADGWATIGWIGIQKTDIHFRFDTALRVNFSYGDEPFQLGIPLWPGGENEQDTQINISVGIADESAGLGAWEQLDLDGTQGVVGGLIFDDFTQIQDCNPDCHPTAWQPCISFRQSDGVYAVAWASAVDSAILPGYNIALQVYEENGTLIAARSGPDNDEYVNELDLEIKDSEQVSPAVAIDDYNNVVVTWVGLAPSGCSGNLFRIFARRFILDGGTLRDPVPANGEGRAGMFVVNTDAAGEYVNAFDAHPTVAMKQYEGQIDLGFDIGSFVIGWNQHVTSPSARIEVRGQYFDTIGIAKGHPVRLNVDDGTDNIAMLAASNQHTLAYGPDHQVAVVWSQDDSAAT